jgi:hypothetical protein
MNGQGRSVEQKLIRLFAVAISVCVIAVSLLLLEGVVRAVVAGVFAVVAVFFATMLVKDSQKGTQ